MISYLQKSGLMRKPMEVTQDLYMSNSLKRFFQQNHKQMDIIKYHLSQMFQKEGCYREYEIMMSIMNLVLKSQNTFKEFG